VIRKGVSALTLVLFVVVLAALVFEDDFFQARWVQVLVIAAAAAYALEFLLIARQRSLREAVVIVRSRGLASGWHDAVPGDFRLTRMPDDKHRYALGDVGTLDVSSGLFRATAAAGGHRWHFEDDVATDDTGAVVGTFKDGWWRYSGRLRWSGRELRLRWVEELNCELLDDERELVSFAGRVTRVDPLDVTVHDKSTEPGLLLFSTWLAWQRTRPRE